MRKGSDVAILSLGHPGNDALSAAEQLQQQGITVAVYDMRFLKPLDTKLLDEVATAGYRRIITIEDGARNGGFGEAVSQYLVENYPHLADKITILAIPDQFITHGTVAQLKHDCGIDTDAIVAAASN